MDREKLFPQPVWSKPSEQGSDKTDPPRVDKETGIYTDPNGKQWAAATTIAQILGVSQKFIKRRLEGKETVHGIDRGGKKTSLYSLDAFTSEMDTHTGLPRVDTETGIYTDPNGKQWAAATTIAQILGVSYAIIADRRAGKKTIHGVGRSGEKRPLYPLDAFTSEIGTRADLPHVDKETGIYTDPNGRRWAPVKIIAQILGASYGFIGNRREGEEKIDGIDRKGHTISLYPLDAFEGDINTLAGLPHVDKETGIYTDPNGRRWAPLKTIARALEVSYRFIADRCEGKETIHGVDRGGEKRSLYPLDAFTSEIDMRTNLARVDTETGIYTDPNGKQWAPVWTIAQILGVSYGFVEKRLAGKETVYGIDRSDKVKSLYPLDSFASEISLRDNLARVDKETGIYTDPNGKQWAPITTIAEALGVSHYIIADRREGKEKIEGISRSGKKISLYPLDAFEGDISTLAGLPRVDKETGIYTDPNGRRWAPVKTIAQILGVSQYFIADRLEGKEEIDGIDRGGEKRSLYPLDAFEGDISTLAGLPRADKETGIYTDPNGKQWAPVTTIAEALGVSYRFIENRLAGKEVVRGIDGSGKKRLLYQLDAFTSEVAAHKTHLFDKVKVQKILTELDAQYLDPRTPEGRLLQELGFALGPEAARDLLYALRAELKTVPVEDLDGRLAPYLGEYRPPRPFPLGPAIDRIVPLLEHVPLQPLLLASVKRECQRAYFQARRASEAPDPMPVQAYFTELRTHVTQSSPALEAILRQAEDYFLNQVLGDVPLPDRVVPSITQDRPFPDIYQRINVNEIRNHQRFLIADEMGVGKSASAILAKESMGMKCALVVAPAAVCETWEEYLSDKVEDGQQVGYFEEGRSPNVLIVKKQRDLKRLESETFDYVVVSREKLNNYYMNHLRALPFDMLVVDEVHQYKKAEKGVYSKNLLDLAKHIDTPEKRLVLLSGTPVPNKVKDVAMLMKLLQPEFRDVPIGSLTRSVLQESMLASRANLLPLMQMKSLADHMEMPKLSIEKVEVQFTLQEEEHYDNLLETDDLEPQVKMPLLRKFNLDPESVMDVPKLESSKIQALKSELTDALKTKRKIIVFVNDYIEDIIRGDTTIIEKLGLPENVSKYVIHGEDNRGKWRREDTRKAFRDDDKPAVLFLSGQTEHLGMDYSYADHVVFYNEPWTYAGFMQQLARVYRPGLKNDLTCRILVTKGTIEEGIFEYIRFKHAAIEKLLRGVPLTRDEHEALQKDVENAGPDDIEVNPELPLYYQSRFARIMKLFGHVKERGQAQFLSSLGDEGREYSEVYEMFGGRSYQDNAGRMCANLIRVMAGEQGREAPDVLDVGSGPAMLRQHSLPPMQENVVSLDLIRAHFEGKKLGMTVVGGMADIPFPEDKHFDYVNMSFAIQDTAYRPEEQKYERIHAFAEAARMLRMNGRLVVNMMYTVDFRDEAMLAQALGKFGLRAVQEYTGEVTSGDTYKSRMLVYEKVEEVKERLEDIIIGLSREEKRGFLFLAKYKQERRNKERGRPVQRDRIVSGFTLGDKEISVELNEEDRRIKAEEQRIIDEVESMKNSSPEGRDVRWIPKEVLVERGYSRVKAGNRYKLFKRVPGDGPITLD